LRGKRDLPWTRRGLTADGYDAPNRKTGREREQKKKDESNHHRDIEPLAAGQTRQALHRRSAD
jgi:hypothetical protein